MRVEPSAAIRIGAHEIYELMEAFLQSGFTREEAFALICMKWQAGLLQHLNKEEQ